MACVRKRRGRYVVDYRDSAGIRRWKSFIRKSDADEYRDKVGPEARQRITPVVPSNCTVKDYAEYWKKLIGHSVKARTLDRYGEILDLHILPRFENARVRDLERGQIKLFLADKLKVGLEKHTVRNIQAVLRTMFNAAIEDNLIVSNPAAKLGRVLRLTVSRASVQEEIKAMTMSQRQHFLATALQEAPHYYPVFFTLGGTGMRLGEALGLQWDDLDPSTQTIRIARAFSEDGTLDTPKSGHGRTVDMSQFLTEMLKKHLIQRKQEQLKDGWPGGPPWLFVSKKGTPLDPANVRKAMQSILKKAKLPTHFTPHSLRHSYASILLADGVSPVYVQEQLGHATIELTVSTYGRWLKKKAPGALDRLDFVADITTGSEVVAQVGLITKTALTPREQEPYLQALTLEPATRIERATCGLRNRCSTN